MDVRTPLGPVPPFLPVKEGPYFQPGLPYSYFPPFAPFFYYREIQLLQEQERMNEKNKSVVRNLALCQPKIC